MVLPYAIFPLQIGWGICVSTVSSRIRTQPHGGFSALGALILADDADGSGTGDASTVSAPSLLRTSAADDADGRIRLHSLPRLTAGRASSRGGLGLLPPATP